MDHFDPDLHCSSLEEADDTRSHQDRKDKGNRDYRSSLAHWAAVRAEVEAAHNFVGGIDSVAADFAGAAEDAAADAAAAGNGDFAA